MTAPTGEVFTLSGKQNEENEIIEKHREEIIEYLKEKYPEEFI